MRKVVQVKPRGKRLKGLDEYEPPDFVGRMARVERAEMGLVCDGGGRSGLQGSGNAMRCWNVRVGAVVVGVGIGLVLL